MKNAKFQLSISKIMLDRPKTQNHGNTTIAIYPLFTEMFYSSGLLWIECKQIHYAGVWVHFRQYYNFMDFTILALYISSYSLRYVTYILVTRSDRYNVVLPHAYQRAQQAILDNNKKDLDQLCELLNGNNRTNYFLRACKISQF